MAPRSPLEDEVQFLRGIGPAKAQALERLGVRNVRDLLYLLPRSYLDRGRILPIRQARPGELVMLEGVLGLPRERPRRGGASLLQIPLADDSGSIELVWFRAPSYLRRRLLPGTRMLVTGMPLPRPGGLQIAHPILEPATGAPSGILPSYPLTEGISQGALRAALPPAVARYAALLGEFLPREVLARRALPSRPEALRRIHAPASVAEAESGRRRLAYDELFLLQLEMARRRARVPADTAAAFGIDERLHGRILARLPFKPTRAQERVFGELRADLASRRPMNRLLQGDVGSGKTAVAVYAMLAAVGNGLQAALMAPTEILAEQHARTLEAWLKGSRVRWALLRGGLKPAERRSILRRTASGELDLLVGTHALIQKRVKFKRLALCVVDEQHRFGVLQREELRQKGADPHLLVMTATPIPRTLMLTLYGDLEISTLDELPPGRKPVRTKVVSETERGLAWAEIRSELASGRQAYFVAPLIDESETVRAKSALRLLEEAREAFPRERILFLHGRLPPEGRRQVMDDFRGRRASILVSTQVIEVGVDVPNASVMVVESAERYGLAQLHQLRGRIVRGRHPSVCFLFTRSEAPEALHRLGLLESTQDGFRIAEEDLKLRGPGEFLGTRQHGLPELKVASLSTDLKLLLEAREDAFALAGTDAGLRAAAREHFPGLGP